MAEPFSWAGIGTAASIIGGGVSAYGAVSKGASDQAMYGYQAGVAQLNQKISLQNAAYTREAGGTAVYQSGLKTAATVSVEKVAQSGSGIDVNTGSAESTRAATTSLGQYDEGLIATNYAKKAYGYDVEAATKGTEASADIIAGEQSAKAGNISAAASLLSTAGSVSAKWLQASSAFGKADNSTGRGVIYAPDDI